MTVNHVPEAPQSASGDYDGWGLNRVLWPISSVHVGC